jgi:PII-like signaling protein
MNFKTVTCARVFTLQGRHDQLNKALDLLRDKQKIYGVTVTRGIAGYGADKEVKTSSLLELSLELPLIIEFYDEPEKVASAIEALRVELGLKHVVTWQATGCLD